MVIQSTLHDYTGGTEDRFEPEPGFDEEIIRQTAGSAREGFAWAFRQAAMLVLSALPLMGSAAPNAGAGAGGGDGRGERPGPAAGFERRHRRGRCRWGRRSRRGARPRRGTPPGLTLSTFPLHINGNWDEVARRRCGHPSVQAVQALGAGSRSAEPLSRCSTYSTSFAADSSGDSDSVSRVSSAASGSS